MFKTTLKGYRRRRFFFFFYNVHLNPSICTHHVFSPSHILGPAIRLLLIVISSSTFFYLFFFYDYFDLLLAFGDTNVFLQNNSYGQDRNEYLPTIIICLLSLERCPKCNRLLFIRFINFIYLTYCMVKIIIHYSDLHLFQCSKYITSDEHNRFA